MTRAQLFQAAPASSTRSVDAPPAQAAAPRSIHAAPPPVKAAPQSSIEAPPPPRLATPTRRLPTPTSKPDIAVELGDGATSDASPGSPTSDCPECQQLASAELFDSVREGFQALGRRVERLEGQLEIAVQEQREMGVRLREVVEMDQEPIVVLYLYSCSFGRGCGDSGVDAASYCDSGRCIYVMETYFDATMNCVELNTCCALFRYTLELIDVRLQTIPFATQLLGHGSLPMYSIAKQDSILSLGANPGFFLVNSQEPMAGPNSFLYLLEATFTIRLTQMLRYELGKAYGKSAIQVASNTHKTAIIYRTSPAISRPRRDLIMPCLVPSASPRTPQSPNKTQQPEEYRKLPNGDVVKLRRCHSSNGFNVFQETNLLGVIRKLHQAQVDIGVAAVSAVKCNPEYWTPHYRLCDRWYPR
ncbi:hypothetical protein DFP73DRAFT_527517 [Morchella snyderi]|nr:hypothetical protein DFP73DRAFT_527517 [Morchella snyderi]